MWLQEKGTVNCHYACVGCSYRESWVIGKQHEVMWLAVGEWYAMTTRMLKISIGRFLSIDQQNFIWAVTIYGLL